ncbi:Uncharacterized protein TCAP_00303 [Tolypocladium capitatum]|uniref:CFEM domain-containing protein n=1 Tax=Tolypocladium capitatum TaxID=45235 RepID=A0A2K3QQG1_9HYPO|nr:Uncharacterized protein TCAP_00303 [Tolypocladium capitatum]
MERLLLISLSKPAARRRAGMGWDRSWGFSEATLSIRNIPRGFAQSCQKRRSIPYDSTGVPGQNPLADWGLGPVLLRSNARTTHRGWGGTGEELGKAPKPLRRLGRTISAPALPSFLLQSLAQASPSSFTSPGAVSSNVWAASSLHPGPAYTNPPHSFIMRNSAGAWSLLALARLGVSQSCNSVSPCQSTADAVPDCAKSCIESAAVTAASCATSDFACQCSSSAAIQVAALGCVTSGCGLATGIQVLGSVSALCSCVTASPTTPCTGLPTSTTSALITPPPAAPITAGLAERGPAACSPGSPCQKSADAVPKCATSCIFSAATAVKCATSDYQCQCSQSAAIESAAFGCVSSGCGIITGIQVLQSVGALCSCVTASPTTPCSSLATSTTTSAPKVTSNGVIRAKSSTKTELLTVTTKTGGSACSTANCGAVASSAVPSCARKCFSSAAPSVGCSVDDYACQCQDTAQASLSQILVPCVATACPIDAIQSVIAGASSVCKCANAPGGGNCGGKPTATGGETPTGSSTTGGNAGAPLPSGSQTTSSGTEPSCIMQPTSGNGGTPPGVAQPTGGIGGNPPGIGGGGLTTPPVVVGSAGRWEISLMACVFGAFWAIAVAM